MFGTESDPGVVALEENGHLLSLCGRRAETLALQVPFLGTGLRKGQRCLCFLSGGEEDLEDAHRALRDAGIDVAAETARGALQFAVEPFARPDEEGFDAERAVACVRASLEQALAAGFSGLRIVEERARIDGPRASSELLRYEALLDELVAAGRLSVLCQHHRTRSSPRAVHDALRTHAVASVNGHWCWNPYYEPPDCILEDGDPESRRLEWMLAQLERHETGAGTPAKPGSAYRRAQDALRRSELMFRRLLEKLPAGAYTCDAEGLITYFNRQAVEIWGRAPKLHDSEDRFCGSFKLFLSDGTPVSHDRCWMARALQSNRAFNGEEIVIERPDKSRVTVLAHANPIHDETGALLGAVNVLVDITERKRAEESLKEGDRRKNEFLATLAHELRNPLAPIRNALQILRLTGKRSPDAERVHEMMERQVDHLVRLVDDLLEVSRITCGRIELRKEHVELAAVLRSAIETSRPVIEARGHDLTVKIPPERLILNADPVRLAQVVANLLNNAAKYTERGGRIRLLVERDGRAAIIRVRDNGAGVSREMLPRIFDLFVQGGEQGAGGGLGIGLSLVRRLVELHGGTVEAHSAGRGKGSEFRVRLPLLCPPSRDPSPVAARGRSSREVRHRLVVADDNRDAADSLSILLRVQGADVRTAYDGQEALAAVRAHRPAAVLLDLGMPGMNGFETARRIRDDAELRDVVLVALTGWGQPEDRRRSRLAGFQHHLVKPVEADQLEALLAALDERSREGDVPQAPGEPLDGEEAQAVKSTV